MIVLSIDASTHSTGWAVFQDTKLINYGCISSSSTDLIKRIHKMTEELDKIIKEYSVEKIILEEVRPENGTQNIKTHKALMWLQGAIATMAHDNYNKMPIEYLYPNEWRAACGIKTGAGVRRSSLKPKDIQFAKETYGLEVNDDIADAIGLGHAYVNKLDNEINWE